MNIPPSKTACVTCCKFVAGICVLFTIVFTSTLHAATPPVVIEAETGTGNGSVVFRDKRASEGRCALLKLGGNGSVITNLQRDLPAGDYLVTAYLEAVPLETLHTLSVRFSAGTSQRNFGAIGFDPTPGYQPISMRVFHPGGRLEIKIEGSGDIGFEGMRKAASDEEKRAQPQSPGGGNENAMSDDATADKEKDNADPANTLDLEEDPDLSTLGVFDKRIACDRIEITTIRAVPAGVAKVSVDKIHYLPGETVHATTTLNGCAEGGEYELTADLVTEIDTTRQVFKQPVKLAAGQSMDVAFDVPLDAQIEFGHELRCSLRKGETVVHSNSAYFGVSKNVYRVGISGNGGPQDKQNVSPEQIVQTMRTNMQQYANYFEVFAWAPCDYSEMTPDTELFWSGQTQYPGSVTAFKTILAEAHKLGIKGITYGKSCADGIAGFNTFQRHPEFFGFDPNGAGPWTEAFSTFYLDLMQQNLYKLPGASGDPVPWQHWASMWARNDSDPAVDYGADEMIASAKMFGWDGVRWDGHFVNNMPRFKTRVNAALPNFAHGYNVAFAVPGSARFMPPATVDDFHEAAKDHGMIMDESVRDWSNTAYSVGVIRPFYEAIGREADYVKRIGGLPLFITFDIASEQDRTLNVLMGLAAGERFTGTDVKNEFAFGSLPKFLTRFSSLVWDDTSLVASAKDIVKVSIGKGPKDVLPLFEKSTWLRRLPDGRQQLIVNLINPPGYATFCDRVQRPPTTMEAVELSVKTPAGAKLTRVLHVSPDLVDGMEPLAANDADATAVVRVPRLRLWSMVVFEYEATASGGKLEQPAFALTTPIEDAKAALADAAAAPVAVKPVQKEAAKPKSDAEVSQTLTKPTDVHVYRNGSLDVHHARGLFAWLNPIESAVALNASGGGATYRPSWVERVGFLLGADGDMSDFPDDYESLLACDVLVLDNVHAMDLGARRRVMIADFVRGGGGLLVIGGYFNLSCGTDHETALDELLPVTFQKNQDLLNENKGLPLAAVDAAFFEGVKWDAAGNAFCVDVSPLKESVRILATAGGKPAIVASNVGKGRVVTILMNPHGDPAAGTLPYWQSPQWTRVLASCVKWLGEGSNVHDAAPITVRKHDSSKPDPTALLMESVDMDGAKLTKDLRSAEANMVDAESSRTLLQVAVANAEKIDDTEVLSEIVEAAGPYLDESFAALADDLVKSLQSAMRGAGYKVLGLSKKASSVPLLIEALRSEKEEANVREALVALARLKDPQSAAAVEEYLKAGTLKLTALATLKRLGRPDAFARALNEYERASLLALGLTSAQKQAYEVLHGGMSFSLLPDQRRRKENELIRLKQQAAGLRFDLDFFASSLDPMSNAEVDAMVDHAVKSTQPSIVPLAYAVLGRLTPAEFEGYRAKLKEAKLEPLRRLAE